LHDSYQILLLPATLTRCLDQYFSNKYLQLQFKVSASLMIDSLDGWNFSATYPKSAVST